MLHNASLSKKWITAIVTDSSNRIHLIPIKHTLGDYFIVEINRSLYVFKIDGSQIKSYRKNYESVRSVLFYDTSHYKPIGTSSKELELVLKKNSLPKVNTTLSKIFKFLASREKQDFKPHNISELVKELSTFKETKKKKDDTSNNNYNYDESIANVVTYLRSLNTEKIITPLRPVSDFIQEDLLATDPAFMGVVISHYQRADIEHRKITNTPSLGGRSTMKILIFAMIIGLSLIAGVVAYQEGYFTTENPLQSFLPSNLVPSSIAVIDPSDDDSVRNKYPTTASLQNAIDIGEVDYEELSPVVQKMLDRVE